MYKCYLFGLVALMCSVANAQNVPVTEPRVPPPYEIDRAAVIDLAEEIFAESWFRWDLAVPMDHYPSRARITTVYGDPAEGDSLTPVDDRVCKRRPCYVFWKEENLTGVAVEKGVRGNWIVSSFVKLPEERVEVIVDRQVQVVERTNTKTQIVTLQPVLVAPRPFLNPASATCSWAPALRIDTGSIIQGPMRDVVTLGVFSYSRTVCRTSEKPNDGTCGPGGDGDIPPDPPPGNTNPPGTDPPIGDGDGWGGDYQPPDQDTPGGVDGQEHEPPPPPAS